MYDPKNILVTGGCGFIASNFINHMLQKYSDIKIVNLDAMYYCASENNVLHSDQYVFVEGNINNANLVYSVLVGHAIDTVFHFAAQSHVDHSFSNPLQYTHDNVLGTHTLLETCRRYDKVQRFIHVSTDEVYGESKQNELEKDETQLLCPTNPYAASKAAAEMMVNSYIHSYKMPIIITRGNNVYGPRQYPEKLIPKFICLLNENKPVTLHGQGLTKRTFIHVDDVARAFECIMKNGQLHEIYNIGSESENEYTIVEIAQMLIKKLKPNEDPEKYISYVKDREFNDFRYFISNEKLKDLGWSQEISMEDGINQTIDWYLNHVDYHTHWSTR